jgi:hypothetical protein
MHCLLVLTEREREREEGVKLPTVMFCTVHYPGLEIEGIFLKFLKKSEKFHSR